MGEVDVEQAQFNREVHDGIRVFNEGHSKFGDQIQSFIKDAKELASELMEVCSEQEEKVERDETRKETNEVISNIEGFLTKKDEDWVKMIRGRMDKLHDEVQGMQEEAQRLEREWDEFQEFVLTSPYLTAQLEEIIREFQLQFGNTMETMESEFGKIKQLLEQLMGYFPVKIDAVVAEAKTKEEESKEEPEEEDEDDSNQNGDDNQRNKDEDEGPPAKKMKKCGNDQ
ncbi:unnamed protein product [Orchesella dallaii]|uniref:Uncharacterized protein n=1 Tax=Orchesella dallaii TaxID=48710 RepID=A0ABP1RY63_9HEXA